MYLKNKVGDSVIYTFSGEDNLVNIIDSLIKELQIQPVNNKVSGLELISIDGGDVPAKSERQSITDSKITVLPKRRMYVRPERRRE